MKPLYLRILLVAISCFAYCGFVPSEAYGQCAGLCGSSAGSCWCDASCVTIGDCCPDACSICGYCSTPPPPVCNLGCTQGLESNPLNTAPSGCNNGSVSLGSGAYYNIAVAANTYYVFNWSNGSGGTISGFCATPQNGSGSGFTSDQSCWFSGTTTSLQISAYRTSCTWSTSSAQMTYRHTTPTSTANSPTSSTFCSGGSVSISGGTASCGSAVYWQGTNPAGTNTTSGPQTVTASGTYYYRPYNNGCFGTAQGTSVTVLSAANNPGAITLSASTICVGTAVTVNNTTSATTGSPASAGPTYYHYYSLYNTGGYLLYSGPTSSPTATLPSAVINTPGTHYIARNSEFGCAGQANNSTTVNIPITVVANPTVDAGPAMANICAGVATPSLGGSVGGGATGGTWTSNAGGTFSPNANTPTATWTPQAGYSGTATLTLTTTGMSPCAAVSASKTVTVIATPTANAGAAMTNICQGGTTAGLGGSFGGGATGATWSTSSGGTFSPNASTLNATWTPPVGFSGTATLTLTTSGSSPCSEVTASKTVTVIATPTAGTITGDQTVCTGGVPSTISNGVSGGGSGTITYLWESSTTSASSGFGYISGATGASYTSGALTQTTWFRRTTVSTLGGVSCESVVTNVVQVNVVADPIAPTITKAPADAAVCAGTVLTVNVTGGIDGTGSCANEFRYSTNNGSTFSGWSVTLPSIVAVEGTTIIEARRECSGSGCNSSVNSVSWIVNPVPAVVATPASQSFCSGNSTSIALTTNPNVPSTTFAWTVTGAPGTSGFANGTGNSIAQQLFNTGAAPAIVTYTVTPTAFGCVGNSIIVQVTVNPIPDVVVSPPSLAVCNGALASMNLTSAVTGTSFSWTVSGTPGTGGFSAGTGNAITQVLTNSTLSPGTVTYAITPAANGCTGSVVNFPVTVNNTPAVTFSSFGGPYCISQTAPISLVPFASPAGGVFSGTGVAGNDFVPSLAAVGTNTITYTYTDGNSCVNTATTTVVVTGLPLVTFSGLGTSYCINNTTPVTLFGFPTGGTFMGPGISGNTFTPSVAGDGLHNITYMYTDGNGCVNSQTRSTNVFELPVVGIFDLEPSYCIADAPVTISGFPPGGTFSGPGMSGTTFSPAAATVGGPYTITYTYTDGNSCTNSNTATTTVFSLPVVSFTGLASNYCVDAPAVTLVGSPAGGTFSGPGVTGTGVFTPQTAGIGTHPITYTYTNGNGCTDFQTQSVVINGLPNVSFTGLDSEYCIDEAPITLFGNQAPAGTFSGTGITNNGNGTATFNPATATVGGPYNITYTFSNGNGCGGSQMQQVVVNPLPAVSFTGLPDASCIDGSTITLTGIYAPDGTFSGNGITDNGNGTATFNPTTAGSGPHTITYTYIDGNACMNSNSQSITVNPTPTVSYTGFGSVCVDQPSQPLTGTPAGGTYSGTGVSGNAFFPTVSGVGIFPVTYTYTDGNGCDDTFTENFNVHNIPVITVNPLSVQVCPGDAVTFLVAATGTGLSYQWQINNGSGFVDLNNGGIYSGVTTTALNIGPIAQSMNGFQYRAVVSGSTCATEAFTTPAAINISTSPIIATQPTDQFVCVGADAQFTATANGFGLTYQWQINTGSGWSDLANGGAYSGTTTATLTVSNYTAGMDGDLFRVVVSGSSNCTSSATSDDASINGSTSPTILTQPADQSICDGGTTTFAATASGSGLVYQWQVNSGSGWGNLSDGGIYSGANTATLTLTGATSAEDGFEYRVEISSAGCPGSSISTEVTLTITTSPGLSLQPADVQVCVGDNANFTVVANGSGNTYQWQINTGSGFNNIVNGGAYSGATTASLDVSGVTSGMNGHQFQVIVQNPLCASATVSAIAILTESATPTIATQPMDGYFCAGDNVTFTASANGSGLAYQWQVNTGNGWVNVSNDATYSGATTAALTVSGVTSAMNGDQFRLNVAGSVNCSGSALTAVVQLIETNAPVILTQPTDQGVCENSGAMFTVTAAGTVTYQWQVNTGSGFTNVTNGGIYSGATAATLNLSSVSLADDGNQYQVIVSGANCPGSTTSQLGTLTITNQPTITSQSPDQYVCSGDNGVFAVNVAGTGLTYQWQENSGSGFVNISNGASYSGATSAVLAILGVTSAFDGNSYQVIVSSGNCPSAATSVASFLYENTGPVVLTDPSDIQTCPGDNAVFTVSAGGTGLTYQWQVNSGSGFTDITDNSIYSGSSTSSLLVQGTTAGMNNYQYRAIISGSVNCAVSATSVYGVLTISSNPTITLQPTDLSYCDGDNATLTVTANGAQGYQWQENTGSGWADLSNGGIYAGVNTATLVLSGIPAANDGFQYRVIVSGSANCEGTATSNAATITEDSNPFISQQPVDQFVCPGDAATFAVTASGSGLVYQWQENSGSGFVNVSNGGVYSGANTANLTISDATGLDGYQYQAIITGTICTGSSTTVTATLNETTQPAILDQPDDVYACANDIVSFSVSAGGSGLTYQWQVNAGSGFTNVNNGVLYSGATTATLTVNGVNPGMDGSTYQVIISGTNCPGSSTSSIATLNINTAPIVTVQPANDAVCSGQPAGFSFSAVGPNLTYQWQVNDGSGFVNIFNNNTYSGATTTSLSISVAPFAMNGYQYRAIVTGSINCAQTATTSVVTLSVTEQPVANAGAGGTSCDFTYTFGAAPSVGIGTWTQVSGPGTSTFLNPNSPTAVATASVAGTYVYQWEEVQGICSDNDTVTVVVYDQPVSDAGTDGDECDLDFVFSAVPSFGTGTWTQVSGPGTSSYSNVNGATATATVTTYGTYTYRWTEVNGTCSDFDEVTVNYYQQPVADAGTGGDECDLTFLFNAQPTFGTGVWTSSGPGTATFNNSTSPVATVTVSQTGTYTFTWTETNGTCVSSDNVTVIFWDVPVADAGQGGSECNLDYSFNATISTGTGTGLWTYTSGPGTATFDDATDPFATATVTNVGTYVFTWTETNGVCSDAATVTVNFYNQPVADAGTGGDECDTDFVLNAVPTFGIGTWAQTTGPGFVSFSPNANAAGATVTVSQYGTYQFTWTEVDGVCVSSDAITVNFYEQPFADAGIDADECDLDHVFGAIPSVGLGTWTQISGPGTSSFLNANQPTTTVTVSVYGTYTYEWEEVEGTCSDADNLTINFYEQPVANAGFGGFECDLDFQLAATASVGLGTWTVVGPGTATYAPNANDPNALVTVSALGSYTFTWTEVNGTCVDSDDLIVTFQQQTIADAGNGGDECDLTFSLNAIPSFGTGVWTAAGPGTAFYVDPTSATSQVTVSAYGTYTFTWTETNGTCISSDQVSVNFYEQPVADAGQGGDACYLDFVFTGTASVGVGTWTQTSGSGTSSFSNANSATATVTVSQYGTYSYTWTEVNGTCSDSEVITVNFYAQPVANAGSDGDACDLDFALAAVASVGNGVWTQTSGSGTSTFGSTTSAATTVTVSQYGTYTYTWTETNGTCVSSDAVTVNYYDQPVANAGNGGDECDLDFMLGATLSTGTGLWTQTSGSGTATFSDASSPAAVVTVTQADTYVFTWTETNGSCTDTDVVTVNFWNQPVADAGQGGNRCNLDFNLNAIPSLGSGEWTQTSGPGTSTFISATSANTTVSVSLYGSYIFTWTETNGVCVSSDTAMVSFYDQPVADAGQGGTECDVDFILNATLTTGTGTWSQTAGSGFSNFAPDASDPNATVTVSQYGTYSFTWTEVNGVCTDSDVVTVDFFEQPVANAGPVSDQCDLDITFAAVASAGVGTWTYTGPGTATFSPDANTATATATVDQYGVYDFTWTEDNGGCTDAATVSVTFNPLPVVSFTGLAATYCVDQTSPVQLTGSPLGGTYDGAGISGSVFLPFIAGVGTHDITYEYTDVNGCINSETQSVDVNAIPVVTFSGLGAEYCEDDNTPQTLVGSPAGGTFSGSGITGDDFIASNAGVGTHVITYEYTDPLGCTGSTTQTVVVNPLPVVTFTGLSDAYCVDAPSVTLVPSIVGSTFSGPGVSGSTFSPTVAGVGTHDIICEFTDANGCYNSITQTVTINPLPQPVITPNGTQIICAGSSITLDAGNGFAQYSWNTNQNGQSITVTDAGFYRVTVTTAEGCTAISATVEVIVNSLPVVDLGNDTTVCAGSFVTLDAGNAGLDFEWSTSEITQQIIVGSTDNYEVEVTDANGCVGSDVILVTFSTFLEPVITANGPTEFCNGQSVQLSGPSNLSYLWNTGETSQNIQVSTAGPVQLTVEDQFGCSGVSNIINITITQLPNAVIVPSGSTNLCQGASVTLSASNAFGNYSWTPTGQTTQAITVSTPGSYTVSVTDPVNGCVATSDPMVVTLNQNVQPTLIAEGPVEFCDGGSVVLSVQPFGAFSSYLWTSGSNTPSIDVTESGEYAVQVIDMNNCLDSTTFLNPMVVTVWNPQPIVEQNGGTLAVINGPFASYQWFRNGNPVPGATSAIFTPEFSGNHFVQVTDANDCHGDSDNIEFTVGIAEAGNTYDLKVYPSPTGGQFTVESDLGGHTDVTLVLKDMLGRELMKPERVEGASSFRRSFDISHLGNGVYFVHIVGNEGFTIRSVVKH